MGDAVKKAQRLLAVETLLGVVKSAQWSTGGLGGGVILQGGALIRLRILGQVAPKNTH